MSRTRTPVQKAAPPPPVNGKPNIAPPPVMQRVDDGNTPINMPIGVTGLKRPQWRGQIQEEFLQELSGQRAVKVFREMRDNDSIIGAVMFAIESMCRGVDWAPKGGNDQSQEFLGQCMEDMRPNFGQTITEVLSMLTYGWSWHEVLYKKRSGPTEDEATSSKNKDGRIGWQAWPIRSQDSMYGWQWDDLGRVNALLQQAPPTFQQRVIPIQRSLHFTTSIYKRNPEGRSLFRSAYRAWLFRRNIETIEAIGAERDLAGMPVFYRDIAYANLDNDLKAILRNIKRDEQEGLIVPLVYNEQGKKLIELELLSSGGTRQFDAGKIIERKAKEIASVMLADFILLGHENVGSFALSTSKTSMFMLALYSILENIKNTINEVEVPRLLRLNGMPVDDLPYLDFGQIEETDLVQLGDFIQKLATAGMPLFPDEKLEAHLRDVADLPEKSEEAMVMQADQRQAQIDARAAAMESLAQPGAPGNGRMSPAD